MIHILSREQDGTETPAGTSDAGAPRYRRSSRNRSRSQLDLTALDAAVGRKDSAANLAALHTTALEETGASKRPAAGKQDE